jgi:alpha-D-xyloside xylohydrolase
VVNFAREKPDAPLELRIYRGRDAAFTLYEDAGDGYDYEQGQYSQIPIAWNQQTAKLTVGRRSGPYPGMIQNRQFRVVWVESGKGAGLPEAVGVPLSYTGDPVELAAP